MAKYLVTGEYVGDGVAGLLKEGGTSRLAAVRTLVESVGCTDVYVIVALPDETTATAVSLTVNSTGVVSIDVSRHTFRGNRVVFRGRADRQRLRAGHGMRRHPRIDGR